MYEVCGDGTEPHACRLSLAAAQIPQTALSNAVVEALAAQIDTQVLNSCWVALMLFGWSM